MKIQLDVITLGGSAHLLRMVPLLAAPGKKETRVGHSSLVRYLRILLFNVIIGIMDLQNRA